jgi:hypothetical protein
MCLRTDCPNRLGLNWIRCVDRCHPLAGRRAAGPWIAHDVLRGLRETGFSGPQSGAGGYCLTTGGGIVSSHARVRDNFGDENLTVTVIRRDSVSDDTAYNLEALRISLREEYTGAVARVVLGHLYLANCLQGETCRGRQHRAVSVAWRRQVSQLMANYQSAR